MRIFPKWGLLRARTTSWRSPSVRIPSRPPASSSRWSTSAHAIASGSALWFGLTGTRKYSARVCRRTFGTSGHTTRRASRAVHTGGAGTGGYPSRSSVVFTNEKSNRALCATNTPPSRNSARSGATASIGGWSATMRSSMPVRCVMNRGIGIPGSTSVENVPKHSPPRYLTAPTSVMALSRGEPPVVSRSTAQKVTSDSGNASSSVAWCASSPHFLSRVRGPREEPRC